MIDIPTALSPIEADALAQLATAEHVLEVGSLLGFSTVTMAITAASVASVDPHDGYPADNPRPTWEPFLNNLFRFGVIDNVHPIRELATRKTLSLLVDEFPAPGFAFIDVDGTYENTIEVIEAVDSVMHVDSQFIAVHDYGLLDWPGAGAAVRDFCTQRGTNFGLIDTLALIRRTHPDD